MRFNPGFLQAPIGALALALILVHTPSPLRAQPWVLPARLLQDAAPAPAVVRLGEPYRGFAPRAVVLSADGRWLASASAAEEVLLWPLEGEHRLDDRHRFDTPLAMAGTGDRLLFARQRDLQELPLPTAAVPAGEVRLLGVAHEPVARVAASSDGRLVATGGHGGLVELWTRDTQAPQRLQVPKTVTALAFSGDARVLAIGDRSGSVTLLRVGEAGLQPGPACAPTVFVREATCALSRWSLASDVRALALNADGSILVTADWLGGARVWDLLGDQHRPLDLAALSCDGVSDLALSADGRRLLLATVHCPGRADCVDAVLLWDLQQHTVSLLHRGHQAVKQPAVSKVAMSADGRVLAARLSTGEVLRWLR